MKALLSQILTAAADDKPFAIAFTVALLGVVWSWIYLALMILRWRGFP